MGALMNVNLEMPMRGEYMAVVHTGHTYDRQGNIVKEGTVLRKSAWSKNVITLVGFNALLTSANVTLRCVAGAGTSAASEGNTVLGSYLGAATSTVMFSRTLASTPDGDGFYPYQRILRATFNPGALGTGAVNVSEAGMAMSLSPTALTNLFSRGLLVDEFGAPVTISLNASTEFLDIYWKYTRYIRAETAGTVSLDILGTPTNHNYIIRPVFLDPAQMVNPSTNNFGVWWGNDHVSTDSISPFVPTVSDQSFGTPFYGPRVFDGDLTAGPIDLPAGAALQQTSISLSAYTPNSKNRSWSVLLGPAAGNHAAHIRSFTLRLGNAGYKVQVDPRIEKNATPARSLRLDFNMAYGNR